jgi:predicted DsbA family dithiol-disulfide isomerase
VYNQRVLRSIGSRVLVLMAVAACGGARPEAGAKAPAGAGPARRPLPVFPGIDVTDSMALGMVDGPNTAEVTVIEAFDLACPHCEQMQAPLDELVREYRGRIRVVYKSWVLPRHTADAHLAACAAGKQGKFRAFVDALRAEHPKHQLTDEQIRKAIQEGKLEDLILRGGGEPDLAAIAQGVGVERTAFDAERNGAWCRAFLDRDQKEIDGLDIDHLPYFLVADKRVDTMSKEELRAAIDASLAAAR